MKTTARSPHTVHLRPGWLLPCALAARRGKRRRAQKLTYVDLVNRLTDLERLAALPAPGEKCAQWSSYDRASKYDEATGKYVELGRQRRRRRHHPQGRRPARDGRDGRPGLHLADLVGHARSKGHVTIYLDGASEPAVDLPFTGYFDGKNAPFTTLGPRPHGRPVGWNNYMPIPYQKSCKIVADTGWGAYYHFTYTTYPKGTQVPTFKRQLSAAENAALDEANDDSSASGGTDPAGQPPRQENAEQDGDASRRARPVAVRRWRARGPITGIRVKLAVRRPRGRDGRPARARAADHLGRRGEAGRLVPAGRFLRHRPRREPVQVASRWA